MRTLKPIAVALALIAGAGLSLVACQPAEPTAMPEPVSEPTAEMVVEPTEEMTTTDALTTTAAMTSPLDGPTWVLVSHGDPMSPTLAVSGTRVTANFAEGRVSGNGGCNNYSGDFTVDGDSLTVGTAASTMMFCEPQEVMDQEQAYLALLGAAASFAIVDDTLTITTADGQVLNYMGETPAGLEGTWSLINYNNGQEAVVGLEEGTAITATFEAGQVTGNSGCNNFFAGYTVDGNTITIDPPGGTRMACEPQAVMDQEAAFLAALESAATWSIDGDTLAMRTADDAMAVNFTRVMTDTTATE